MTGKDLIQMGYKPAKWFAEALIYANSQPRTEQELRTYIDTLQPKQYEPFSEPLPFEIYIEGDHENVQKSIEAMTHVMTSPTAVSGALMPDACPTGKNQIPVGGVIETHNAIHPAFHSADICCSLFATNFGHENPKTLLDRAHKATHFGPTQSPHKRKLPEELLTAMQENPFFSEKAIRLAEEHLGTQGDGNHFLFVGTSKATGDTWMVTHHGSRGVGAEVYKAGQRVAERFRREIAPKVDPSLSWIPADTREGRDYWYALQTVEAWTYRNHATIHMKAGSYKNGLPYVIYNPHNFVFKDDKSFFHAKGATPMFEDDYSTYKRLIPLNMAEPILVVERNPGNHYGFAPHGAGRNESRTTFKRANPDVQLPEGLDIRFYTGVPDISELPGAYKSAGEVRAQIEKFNLCTIVDEIEPYGCIMAGEWKRQ